MKWFQILALSTMLILSGCASINKTEVSWVYPPMAIPIQSSIQKEIQIARLSQLLTRTDLSDDIRAKMLYERGNYYDSVGLRDLARLDFTQSLRLNPAQPDIFNLLGVYFTQVGDFDAAYEAFDSTLELDPENQYAERNRAIALYYGGRIALAYEEMLVHYNDAPEDPFRALWLYIVEREIDSVKAEVDLIKRYQARNDDWGWNLVAIMLNETSEETIFKDVLLESSENTVLAQRLTEVYFYLGKHYQLSHQYADAIALYKLALSLNVYEYVEHRYSTLELDRIYQHLRAMRKKNQDS